MQDITKEFIRNIPLEKYLKNVKNRKIVVWGNGMIGEKILDILQERGYKISYVIDKQQGNNSAQRSRCGVGETVQKLGCSQHEKMVDTSG